MAEGKKVEMPRVKLGSQGFEVSKLGYGCMGLTGIYNVPVPEEFGISIIKDAFNKGITFYDTSDIYGVDHANELLVGKALKQLPREKVQLATKFGVFKIEPTLVTVKGTPEYVRSCCEGSLKRLGVEYIDLYYVHRIDTTVPIEETMGELKKLVEEGKVKYIGLSEANPDTIRRAHPVHPITALQMEYSLWSREIEEEIIPLSRELGIGIVPYCPLGRGFFGGKGIVDSVPSQSLLEIHPRFTGEIEEEIIPLSRELGIGIVPYCPLGRGFFGGKGIVDSVPSQSLLEIHPRFTGENFEKNKIIYTRIDALAKKHGCTPAQLALAWVLHQGDDVAPIPGTTKIKNLDDNLGSLTVKLTKDDIKEISDAVPVNEVAGASILEALQKVSWRYSNTPPLKDGKLSA